jgi:hypothetical protein
MKLTVGKVLLILSASKTTDTCREGCTQKGVVVSRTVRVLAFVLRNEVVVLESLLEGSTCRHIRAGCGDRIGCVAKAKQARTECVTQIIWRTTTLVL